MPRSRSSSIEARIRAGNPAQLATAILAGELDAAFVIEPVPEQPFERAAAFEEDLVIVARQDHPPIRADSPPPETIIAFEQGCPHRKRLESWYETPRRIIELGSYHAMLGCVVVGMGVALLPRSVLDTFPERHRLSEHALPAGLDRAATLLIRRRGAGSPKIEALKSVLDAS